jgi:hypothetical protein
MMARAEASASAEAADEQPSKRRRVETLPGGLAFLALDCLLVVLGFLELEDVNTFAICSRQCREARSDPSLDQTRTGFLRFTSLTQILQVYHKAVTNGWINAFTGNRTRLCVSGLSSLQSNARMAEVKRQSRGLQLTGVTSLDLSFHPDYYSRTVKNTPVKALALILPNLKELNLNYMQATNGVAQAFCKHCPNLKKISWNGSSAELFLLGQDFMDAAYLAELHLDDCRFYNPVREPYGADEQINGNRMNMRMWMFCKRLERLSIKNARTWNCYMGAGAQPLSQCMIINFVRHTPILRWLRSDLTEENVAMLQQERPDVTFVTD